MSEKKLIEYLLNKEIFTKFESEFNRSVFTEIESSFNINSSDYKYIKRQTDTLDIIFGEEKENFIKSLLIKYFNILAKKEKINVELSEEDKKDLCKTNICNKLFGEDKKNFYQILTYNVDTFIDITEVEKEFGEDFKNKKVEILYQYFYGDNVNWNNFIKDDLDKCVNMIIKRFKFKNNNYKNILNKIKKIRFVNCKFINIDTKDLIDKKDIDLYFEKCEIFGQFKHIFSKSIIFDTCPIIEKYYYSNVSEEKVLIDKLFFKNCKIDKLELKGVILSHQLFKNTNEMKDEYKKINLLELKNCEIKKDFIIDIENREDDKKYKRFEITKLDLTNTIFNPNIKEKEKAKVKIQFCDIGIGIFYNTSFHDLADFYQTTFKERVDFERADFFDISVFSETVFNCDLNFNYVKFFGKAIFRDTVVTKTLNLRNTIFDDEANFLDITSERREKKDEQFIGEAVDIKVANRETARVIKNFYDNSNNVIEANRFYKLEMVERTKEFSNMKFNDNVLFEKLVFHLHGLSSNHSQSWALSLFWIIFLGIFYTLINDFYFYNSTLDYTCGMYWSNIINNPLFKTNIFIYCSFFLFLVLFILPAIVIKHESAYIVLFGSIVIVSYIVFTKDTHLSMVSKNLNPFSIMRGNESISVSTLFFKIIIAYLIYQLIISIRQNTRRK